MTQLETCKRGMGRGVFGLLLAAWGALLAWEAPLGGAEPAAPVYNIRLVTDSTPDLTDVPSYLRSITAQYEDPQEQAISIWRWSQRLRKQTSNPKVAGLEILDPIVLLNSYGHCNCGIVSGLNNTFWLNMGWQARYVQLGDHTVCETSWDEGGAWHMFDSSMSFYCFNDEGVVASVREIERNPRFYLENFAPECGTNPVRGPNDHQGWRQASDRPVHYRRTLANGVDSFKAPNGISSVNTYAQWGQRFVLNLRPGEQYTRYFHPLTAEEEKARLHLPLENGKDVEEQHGHRLRANGRWRYSPDLRAPGAANLLHDSHGLVFGDPRPGYAARPAEPGVPGVVVLKVSAAHVAASGRLRLVASRAAEADSVEVEVSTDAGINYAPAGVGGELGAARPWEIDLHSLVAGAREYLVRIRLHGAGAGLESAELETITQIAAASLPRLVRGPNRVQLTLGPQVETIQFQPPVARGLHGKTADSEAGIDVETQVGYYKPILRPAENGKPCHVTWKLTAPTPITEVTYGGTVCVKTGRDRVTLLHSFDGAEFTPAFEKTDGSEPFDLLVLRNAAPAAEARSAWFRYEFETARSAESYSGPGIQMAQMTVHHRPRVEGFTPILVTYCWVEHREQGNVERRYTARIDSPAAEFTVNVGGYRDPTMKWLRVHLEGSAPQGEVPALGYSDGDDPGPAARAERALYRWGENLALGRGYTLAGRQSEKNRDAGGDLTDGVIAPPDEYVSERHMPTNVIFERDSEGVAVIDLGARRKVAAVRVHAGQEPGFRLAFPETITVEVSQDERDWRPAGSAGHHQVFHPPADFVPWENDESPAYAHLPAGGRLAYAYRVLFAEPVEARYVRIRCAAQPGWGLLLSEMQVFDRVTVERNLPPAVYLPPLAPATER